MATLREQVLHQANPVGRLRREPVEFMGHTVWAWELSTLQADAIESAKFDLNINSKAMGSMNLVGHRARVIMAGTRESGEDGARALFHDGDDRLYLNNLPAREVVRLYEAILRVSGATADETEEIRKNSATAPASGPGSGSPNGSGAPSPNSETSAAAS